MSQLAEGAFEEGSREQDGVRLRSTFSVQLGLVVLAILPAIIAQIYMLIPAVSLASVSPTVDPPPIALLQLRLVAGGYESITDIVNAGDEHLFVAQRSGIVSQTTLSPTVSTTVFLDIRQQVASDLGEQGLSSVAFHPNYATNGYFYVAYTSRDGHSLVSRFERGDRTDQANPDSEAILLSLEQTTPYHNLGQLAFGPDGYLYIGIGDGGAPGKPSDHSQNTATLPGSILRLDVDSAFPYAIPLDNPFANDPEARGEIWAYGLRNPWRFSFDPLTHDLFIAEVGEAAYEEVNVEPAESAGGVNYGWYCYEGFEARQVDGCGDASLYTPPVFAYNHRVGCAIIGGYLYRGADYPGLNGHYLFADFCRFTVTSMAQEEGGHWSGRHSTIVPFGFWNTFGQDQAGEVYIGSSYGKLYKIVLVEMSLPERLFLPIMAQH